MIMRSLCRYCSFIIFLINIINNSEVNEEENPGFDLINFSSEEENIQSQEINNKQEEITIRSIVKEIFKKGSKQAVYFENNDINKNIHLDCKHALENNQINHYKNNNDSTINEYQSFPGTFQKTEIKEHHYETEKDICSKETLNLYEESNSIAGNEVKSLCDLESNKKSLKLCSLRKLKTIQSSYKNKTHIESDFEIGVWDNSLINNDITNLSHKENNEINFISEKENESFKTELHKDFNYSIKNYNKQNILENNSNTKEKMKSKKTKKDCFDSQTVKFTKLTKSKYLNSENNSKFQMVNPENIVLNETFNVNSCKMNDLFYQEKDLNDEEVKTFYSNNSECCSKNKEYFFIITQNQNFKKEQISNTKNNFCLKENNVNFLILKLNLNTKLKKILKFQEI